jgi:hypothetical protein
MADPPADERCAGCDALAPLHPWAGVTRDLKTGRMVAFPVCAACHTDPAHRQHPLKMHFFDRASAGQAVRAAEANILVEPSD